MEMFSYEKQHLSALREHLAECTVLLKSDGSFPLERPCRIAAYGSGVRGTVKGGTGSGEVNSRCFVNVEQGLTEAGFRLTSGAWLDAYEKVKQSAFRRFVDEIKQEAKRTRTNAVILGMGRVMPEPEYELPLSFDSDCAIYVLSRISGEGNDRRPIAGDVFLTGSELRDICALNERYERFMLVINTGGPVDLTPVMGVRNILVLSQLGVETGAVLADVLLGRQTPSGKLTTTWSSWADYCPDIEFGAQDDTCYREGIYVGYRYFDTVGKKALFPFGHGLSYTAFTMETESAALEGTSLRLKVKVSNIGAYAGRQVVQVYLSAPRGKLDKPWQELAGFGKTKLLQPGESETEEIAFDFADMASFEEEGCRYVLEAGDYIVRVGDSSTETTPAALVALDGEAEIRRVHSVAPEAGFTDLRYAGHADESLPEDILRLSLSHTAFRSEAVAYDRPETVLPELKSLGDEELAYLNIGAFDKRMGFASVIGNGSKTVCGGAGETTSELESKHIPALVMADGPAGLRLTPEFYRDEKGVHGLNAAGVPDSMAVFMPKALTAVSRLLTGGAKRVPKGVKVEYQYATAIPIGTAIAQSWDPAFAELCGDVVGDEMQRFGVQLWLAPALNIHRSILCGRNFEYYSEDPLLSGRFAAAITRGVQKHKGCGVTIKHFCANNQETNRLNSCSHVSERALREIYLKGFGICIRESAPHAIMTSYNLLNGRHTSESRSLLQGFLRCENAYDGIVMTDWIVAGASAVKQPKYAWPTAWGIAAAGGDLMMPGSKKNYDELLQGLREGKVTRGQLEINASRVIRKARELKEQQEDRR